VYVKTCNTKAINRRFPNMDGNGRTARFVMNSQLVTAGYPWVVIPVERRQEYMAALEQASVEGNIEGVVRFIGRGLYGLLGG